MSLFNFEGWHHCSLKSYKTKVVSGGRLQTLPSRLQGALADGGELHIAAQRSQGREDGLQLSRHAVQPAHLSHPQCGWEKRDPKHATPESTTLTEKGPQTHHPKQEQPPCGKTQLGAKLEHLGSSLNRWCWLGCLGRALNHKHIYSQNKYVIIGQKASNEILQGTNLEQEGWQKKAKPLL